MAPSADAQVDPRILRALRHPIRQRIVSSLCGTPASALELAEQLELPLSRIRRHLRVLIENDAVEQVDGGGEGEDERRYRTMMRAFLDDAHFAQLPPERRELLNGLTLRDIARRIDDGMANGGFRHEQTHVSLTRLLLDEEGWQQTVDLLAGVLEEIMMIESESAERSAQTGEELAGSVFAILHFGKAERT
jgi:DNA-binding transcriptional ArsR family regulator